MYRERLPQLDGGLFVTDGGIETTLIFHQGLDLLKDDEGMDQLRLYYAPYAILARERGLVLESPTWRANPDWAKQIGYSRDELDAMNRKAIALMEELRAEYASNSPIVISGCVGPQSDGYSPATMLTPDATKSHAELDEATELDEGDPGDFGRRHAALRSQLPNVNVLGGCCGTDHRHVESICSLWLTEPAQT